MSELRYQVAEIFHSPQGEGLWTGTPMTFIRFVGCSVGKTICHHCDTDFARPYEWLGGGEFTVQQLLEKVKCKHVCLTGGEPLNQDLAPLLKAAGGVYNFHIETSGTVAPLWLLKSRRPDYNATWRREFDFDLGKDHLPWSSWLWVTVSPKPGFTKQMLNLADELKIIVGGLGDGEGWPGIDLALEYAPQKPVYLQPRNGKKDVNYENLNLVKDLVMQHPELRLSAQTHKFIKVR